MAVTKVEYGAGKVTNPVITLEEDVSSWEDGDEIVIASTDYNQHLSETFVVLRCKSCNANQIQLDRIPTYLHWGRIDERTGLDQRAEVGLLSRNVRVTSELGDECQYAYTRDAINRIVKAEYKIVSPVPRNCDEIFFSNILFKDKNFVRTCVQQLKFCLN